VAVTAVLSEVQRAVLAGVADTLVPAVDRPEDPHGFWARSASDLGVPQAIELFLAELPEEELAGVRGLLDALRVEGFDQAPGEAREAILHGFMDAGPDALAGLSALKGLTMLLFYGLPDPATGRNPNWPALGYPGPLSAPPDTPKTIRVTRPESGTLALEADVCVVGSGAGGGVIAGTLAQAGKDVVVLEMGGYYNEADFNQVELWALQNLYRGGGLTQTDDGSATIMAGANLGGGTTVNWTNCLRTRPSVRQEWAGKHGLDGLDGPDYDRHLDAVWERLGVTEECSDHNRPTELLESACRELGYPFKGITRNADPASYDPRTAGFLGFGDQSGSKRGTLKTYLEDAHAAGARFVVNCRADRIFCEQGRAAGVEGTYIGPDGRTESVVVRAPHVVAAGGALETPALLLRSHIGGPAVGRYLRLHPATAVIGVYDEKTEPWWGAPQTGLSDEFAELEDGYGFLIETAWAAPASGSGAVPWHSGRRHKELMSVLDRSAPFVLLVRDRGHGRVVIDRAGNAVHAYHLVDELDLRHFRRGLETLVRLHHAAGAAEIFSYHRKLTGWRRGEDLDAFAGEVREAPLAPYEHATFSLHQMGSARMGADPDTSVANPWGELHDVPGVWIGDASAFPTASGTNPMITIMALAHRTAEAVRAGT
jgi:choline dehydrogenase-like flavoprotein